MLKLNFDKIKTPLFRGRYKQTQVDGLNAIVDAINKYGVTKEQAAYVLATAYHETASTMQPIEEYGKGKNKTYGTWYVNSLKQLYSFMNGKKKVAYMKSKYPHLYYGRGYVQLTWYDNYKLAGDKLGIDLLSNPQLALNPHYASEIMMLGMINGWFTGVGLSNYINKNKKDYVEARRIINGTDKAKNIAAYAELFESALSEV